jgi:hypothetical protein
MGSRVARWFIFKTNFQFGKTMEFPRLENVDICIYLEYFTDVWDIL